MFSPEKGETHMEPPERLIRRHGILPRSESERANARMLHGKDGDGRAFSLDSDGMLRFEGEDQEREIVRAFLQSDGGEVALQELRQQLRF